MAQDLQERTFSVQGEARLNLSNIRGSVVISPGEDGTISVTAVKHTDSGNSDDTQVVIEQSSPDVVHVETVYKVSGIFRNHQACRVDYTVTVPRRTNLNVSVVSSSADIRGVEGDHSISTVSGDLDINDLSGRLKLNAVSGRVRGTAITGPMKVETVSGDVTFKDCRSARVNGSSVSGDLEFDLVPGEGPYQFNSVSGNVELTIPAGTGCSLTLSSMSGRLVVDSPEGTNSWGRGQKTATILGGGPSVALKSISGDLRLKQRSYSGQAPVPPVPPVPPVGEHTSRSQAWDEEIPSPGGDASAEGTPSVSEVLDKVDRGELTVEEALKILGAQ